MQFTRVNSNPDETNGLLGVIDKVGLNMINYNIKGNGEEGRIRIFFLGEKG
jgi:hypothetical protein